MRGRAGIIFAVVIVLVICLIFYFFAVRPRRNELAQVQAQIEAENQRTQQLTAELQRLQALQENAPELEAELATIRELVPVRPELPNFIFQVQEAANRAGLDFVLITPELPKQPPEGATVSEVRVTIGAKGGYFAVQDFIRRLYDLDRALRLDNFDLTFESDEFGSIRLNMNGTTRVFYELPDVVAPGTAPAPATTPVPGTTPVPTTTP